MNRLLCFAFIALAVFIQNYECRKREPQVKMVGSKTHWFNRKYVDELVYTVRPHNATYNNMQVHWKIARDLPIDNTLYNLVYVTDEDFKNPRLIHKSIIPICYENELRHSLPFIDVVPESALNTVCQKKGTYDVKDMGNLRIEHLIPNLEEKGKYYLIHYRMGNEYETVLDVSFYCKWGYLKY